MLQYPETGKVFTERWGKPGHKFQYPETGKVFTERWGKLGQMLQYPEPGEVNQQGWDTLPGPVLKDIQDPEGHAGSDAPK